VADGGADGGNINRRIGPDTDGPALPRGNRQPRHDFGAEQGFVGQRLAGDDQPAAQSGKSRVKGFGHRSHYRTRPEWRQQRETPLSNIADRHPAFLNEGPAQGFDDAGLGDAVPDPLVDELILGYAKESGIPRRKVGDEEMVQRCIFALVNEGAAILEEKIAQRASDIDLVYLAGYGFPPFRGGPMFFADSVGLINVVRAMARFATNPHADPAFWKPARLLARLAAEGKTFNAAGSNP